MSKTILIFLCIFFIIQMLFNIYCYTSFSQQHQINMLNNDIHQMTLDIFYELHPVEF